MPEESTPPKRPNTLPHFPTEEEIKEHHVDPRRILLGWPAPDENVLARYRPVIEMFRNLGVEVSEDDCRDVRFEWCLADLMACKQCAASLCSETQTTLRGETVTIRRYEDCATYTGGGWYCDINGKRSQETKQPTFLMRNCPGPITRKELILRMAKRRK